MQLTLAEAENILTRVFSQELENSTVKIDLAGANPNVRGPSVTISVATLDRVLGLMAKQPAMKIDSIKLYREAVPGTGLADAKQYVENLAAKP